MLTFKKESNQTAAVYHKRFSNHQRTQSEIVIRVNTSQEVVKKLLSINRSSNVLCIDV